MPAGPSEPHCACKQHDNHKFKYRVLSRSVQTNYSDFRRFRYSPSIFECFFILLCPSYACTYLHFPFHLLRYCPFFIGGPIFSACLCLFIWLCFTARLVLRILDHFVKPLPRFQVVLGYQMRTHLQGRNSMLSKLQPNMNMTVTPALHSFWPDAPSSAQLCYKVSPKRLLATFGWKPKRGRNIYLLLRKSASSPIRQANCQLRLQNASNFVYKLVRIRLSHQCHETPIRSKAYAVCLWH